MTGKKSPVVWEPGSDWKHCSDCRVYKHRKDFHKSNANKSGMHSFCILCTRKKNSAWVKNNKEKQAASCANWYKKNRERALKNGSDWHYRDQYGISRDEYEALVKNSDRKCQMCSREVHFEMKRNKSRAIVDHCHTTGKIRGILCSQCNQGLGFLGDTKEAVLRALAYLERAVENPVS